MENAVKRLHARDLGFRLGEATQPRPRTRAFRDALGLNLTRTVRLQSEFALRLGLWFQQLRKAEVVAPELGISHFAVAAEVDAIKAAAETLDVAVGERRRELCEHRPPQLEPFIGEVAAVMVVVDHHQRPCPGNEVAARERGQPADLTASSASVEVLTPLNHASTPGLPPRFSQAAMAPNAIRSLPAHTSLTSG